MIFDSHGADSELMYRDGERITILRKLNGDECDEVETGPMFWVRFDDGFVTSAFIDEIVEEESC